MSFSVVIFQLLTKTLKLNTNEYDVLSLMVGFTGSLPAFSQKCQPRGI